MPSVNLSPVFNDQTLNASNTLASGYQLFTYAAGSTTKQTTYTDSSGVTPQSNPIILNSLGYPANPIWLTAGLNYKLVLASPTDTDPPSSPIKTVDNVSGVNDTTSTVTQWVASSLAPTYISANSFSLAGDQTNEFHIGRRIELITSLSGSIYGTIMTSVYGSVTTVTVMMDTTAIDATLTSVNLSILRNDKLAIPISALRGKNYIINGAMTVAQEATSVAAFNTAGAYNSIDMFYIFSTNTSGFVGQVTGEGGFAKMMKLGRTVATSHIGVFQAMYAMDSVDSIPLQGKTVTLSWYAKAGANFSASGSQMNFALASGTGTDQAASAIASWTGITYPAASSQVITTTLTRYSITGAVPANCTQVGFYFNYTPVGTAGADDNLYVTGIQLEVGSVATAFDLRSRAEELELCYHYCYFITPAANDKLAEAWSLVTNSSGAASVKFPVPMRIAPTAITQSGSAGDYSVQFANTNTACSGVPVFSAITSEHYGAFTWTAASGHTAGQGGILYATNTSGRLGWRVNL